jgi:pyridoxal phosphate enzyme (YggS family)
VIGSASDPSTIAANLAAVKARIGLAERGSGRAPGSVSLVAVSKGQGVDSIRAALDAGQRVFGENRVQEAEAKWPSLRAQYADVSLHLIGPLQTNKVREAVALFDVIETLDRPRLAEALAKEIARQGRSPHCLVQVNTGEEEQKAGVLPAEADQFIRACREAWHLPVAGLMCIPPADEPPSPHFAFLAEIARRHGLAQLSMGMSGDFETAIALGATHVRVGTAIFEARG